MGSSSPRLVLIEVERSYAVLLRVLFLIVMCVSSRRRGTLSKFVQVSCQLRKHAACGHASVMICVMSLGNIIIGQTRSLCEVICRRIPRRDTARRSKVGLFVVVSCAIWVMCCVRTSLEGQTSCVFVFSPRIRRRQLVFAGVGPPCVLTKFSVPSHICFCVSNLGSAHDVLPLMVLGSVGCNTWRRTTHIDRCARFFGCVDVFTDTRESIFVVLR